MSICLRYATATSEAEDMLQDAFINLFNAIHQFRFEGSFEGWIKKITVNTCLASLKKKNIKYIQSALIETIIDSHALNAIAELSEKN